MSCSDGYCIKDKNGWFLQSSAGRLAIWGNAPEHGKPMFIPSAEEARLRIQLLNVQCPEAVAWVDNYPADKKACEPKE